MARHPTRSAPKCADCQHLTRNDHCNHPSTRVDLITGSAAQSALYERQRANTPPYGKPADGCGPQGLNFALRLSWRRRLLLALAALLTLPTQAQVLGLHTATWHSRPGYQAATPGAYWRFANGATLGAYRNSEGHGTTYAGWTWSTDEARPLSVAFTAAAATGYSAAPVVPLLAPSVAWRLSLLGDTTLRLVALPKWHPKQGATAVSLTVEVRL